VKTFSSELENSSKDPSWILSGITRELEDGLNNLKFISARGKIK